MDVNAPLGQGWCPRDEAFVVVSEQFSQREALCESLAGEPLHLGGISVLVPVGFGRLVAVHEGHDCSHCGPSCLLFSEEHGYLLL